MTGNLARRVCTLETINRGTQQTMTITWRSPQDDEALACASAEAERAGRLLVVIRKFSDAEDRSQQESL